MGLFGFGKKKKKQEEYDYIYNNGSKSDAELFEPTFGEVYDDVYDEEGNFVYCDYCNSELKWKDGIYVCPNCGQTMTRSEFFNYIGAEPPGPECITCDNLYPGCVICHYGYVED